MGPACARVHPNAEGDHDATKTRTAGGGHAPGSGRGGTRGERAGSRSRDHHRRRDQRRRSGGPAPGSSPRPATCRRGSARSSSPTTRGGSCCPSFRRRATRSGSAATAWSTRRRVTAAPGQDLRLTAAVARTPREAAAVYPAAHWLSLIEPPAADEFPGTGPDGNGISEQLRTRDEYLYNVKACLRCHQVGGRVHARPSERGGVRLERRRVGRARADGAARGRDEHVDVALRARARAGHVRRLERAHRDRRGAAGAAATAGGGAEPGPDPMGVDRRDGQDPR